MSARRVEIVDTWDHYDGFRAGVVRIEGTHSFDGALGGAFYAELMPDNDYMADVWRYRARSLFHMLHPLIDFHHVTGIMEDPGVIEFTSEDFAR